jgi:hypothetical protein
VLQTGVAHDYGSVMGRGIGDGHVEDEVDPVMPPQPRSGPVETERLGIQQPPVLGAGELVRLGATGHVTDEGVEGVLRFWRGDHLGDHGQR